MTDDVAALRADLLRRSVEAMLVRSGFLARDVKQIPPHEWMMLAHDVADIIVRLRWEDAALDEAMKPSGRQLPRHVVQEALVKYGGSVRRTARMLKISETTVRRAASAEPALPQPERPGAPRRPEG